MVTYPFVRIINARCSFSSRHNSSVYLYHHVASFSCRTCLHCLSPKQHDRTKNNKDESTHHTVPAYCISNLIERCCSDEIEMMISLLFRFSCLCWQSNFPFLMLSRSTRQQAISAGTFLRTKIPSSSPADHIAQHPTKMWIYSITSLRLVLLHNKHANNNNSRLFSYSEWRQWRQFLIAGAN